MAHACRPVRSWLSCVTFTTSRVPCCNCWIMLWISSGGLLGLLRQVAYLVGHHRETATLLAGAGGLDGGVEGRAGWSAQRYRGSPPGSR